MLFKVAKGMSCIGLYKFVYLCIGLYNRVQVCILVYKSE